MANTGRGDPVKPGTDRRWRGTPFDFGLRYNEPALRAIIATTMRRQAWPQLGFWRQGFPSLRSALRGLDARLAAAG
jgi:hypothetical protein